MGDDVAAGFLYLNGLEPGFVFETGRVGWKGWEPSIQSSSLHESSPHPTLLPTPFLLCNWSLFPNRLYYGWFRENDGVTLQSCSWFVTSVPITLSQLSPWGRVLLEKLIITLSHPFYKTIHSKNIHKLNHSTEHFSYDGVLRVFKRCVSLELIVSACLGPSQESVRFWGSV